MTTTCDDAQTETRQPNPRHASEWRAWSANPQPIDAYTISKHDTGTGRAKHCAVLPDRNAIVVPADGGFALLDVETDETLFTGASMASLWRQVSKFYGAPVVHEHEGSGRRSRYGTAAHDPLAAPAALKYADVH